MDGPRGTNYSAVDSPGGPLLGGTNYSMTDTVLRRSIQRVIMQELDQGNVAHWAIFPPAKGSDGEFCTFGSEVSEIACDFVHTVFT